MIAQFIVYAVPHGKQRARQATLPNGRVHSYTPKETVTFEREVARAYKMQCKGLMFPENAPLLMKTVCYMPIPKSTPKKLRERMATETVYQTKKPDGSNVLKSVEDALNGIAYKDDAQLASSTAVKIYSERPRVVVTIKTLEKRSEIQ